MPSRVVSAQPSTSSSSPPRSAYPLPSRSCRSPGRFAIGPAQPRRRRRLDARPRPSAATDIRRSRHIDEERMSANFRTRPRHGRQSVVDDLRPRRYPHLSSTGATDTRHRPRTAAHGQYRCATTWPSGLPGGAGRRWGGEDCRRRCGPSASCHRPATGRSPSAAHTKLPASAAHRWRRVGNFPPKTASELVNTNFGGLLRLGSVEQRQHGVHVDAPVCQYRIRLPRLPLTTAAVDARWFWQSLRLDDRRIGQVDRNRGDARIVSVRRCHVDQHRLPGDGRDRPGGVDKFVERLFREGGFRGYGAGDHDARRDSVSPEENDTDAFDGAARRPAL